MNISEAKENIKEARRTKSKKLILKPFLSHYRLTSEDMNELLNEFKQIEGLTELDISNSQITDIEFLYGLESLQILNLHHNKITEIDVLKSLKNLTHLDLGNNQITNIEVLQELNKLTELDLGSNQFTNIEPLNTLTKLRKLNLYSNPIQNTEYFSNLTELKELFLRNTQIKKIEFLEELTSLTTLDISSNKIQEISFLKELKKLIVLNLSSNNIVDIAPLKGLRKMEQLYLGGNRLLRNISPLSGLTALNAISLRGTGITNIDPLKGLKKLTKLDLTYNQITNIESLTNLTNLKELQIYENPSIEEILPKEILVDIQNPQRIINYYLKVKSGKPINEAKIVVVGEADFGKSLLIRRLVYDNYIKTDTTHGIIITEWKNVPVNNEKVKLNIWDFGGQKIMQNTHQYFFTERTLYILVLNARQNAASNRTIEHLERIKSIAGNSPIIIAGNKIDQTDGEFDINRSELREKFNIKGFYGICSNKFAKDAEKYDTNFDEFKKAVIAEIGKLDGIHKPFREEWFKVKNYLEDLKRNKEPFVKFHDYLTFCFDSNVREQIDQTEIVTFLNELGLIVYLQKNKDGTIFEIGDKLIFNPEWLISGVYAIINNPQKLQRRAILDYETFKKILNECKLDNYEYQPEDYKYILKMMIACKLCVKMKNSETDYLIPDHLPEDKSIILKEYENDLGNLDFKINFQFHYTELFDDIFRRFLIAMYDDVYNEYYWKTGIVLEDNNCKAIVTADNSENKIIIKIEGETSRQRQNLLATIHKAFRDIYKSYPNLTYTEWIAHKDNTYILKEYDELTSIEENIEQYAKRLVFCKELGQYQHIDNFLDNVRQIEQEKKEEAKKGMGNGDTIIVQVNAQINKDNSTGHQYNYPIKEEIENKIDELFAKSNENQSAELTVLVDALFSKIDENSLRAKQVPEEKIDEFNKVKYSTDTKAKIKWTYPFSTIIKEVTGFSFDIEREWKWSKEIVPEEFISTWKKLLLGDEIQQTKFNAIEPEYNQPKLLPD